MLARLSVETASNVNFEMSLAFSEEKLHFNYAQPCLIHLVVRGHTSLYYLLYILGGNFV